MSPVDNAIYVEVAGRPFLPPARYVHPVEVVEIFFARRSWRRVYALVLMVPAAGLISTIVKQRAGSAA